MRKKNWVEFNNEPFLNEDKLDKMAVEKISKIHIFKQKKGKKGKTVTIISGLHTANIMDAKNLLKRMKIVCGSGGKLTDQDFQLQGDLVDKVKDFLRKENYQI